MKIKPKNWKNLPPDDQAKFITGRGTGICWCNPDLGEVCEKCKDLPDIKEEDRNYHEEILILLRDMRNYSLKSEVYSILMTLIELDDEKTFNHAFRYEFVENMGTEEYAMENAFASYHKTLRQYDHYDHLTLTDIETGDYISSSCFQSILYDLIHMSEVPYNVFKKLIEL